MNKSKIYGVMPYVAPEVLKGGSYAQAADIYSFGMIMYFIATGRQPFANCAHDQYLALRICNGVRPEIREPEAPGCYINLMKRCWDSNPVNRPDAAEVKKLIEIILYTYKLYEYLLDPEPIDYEVKRQFDEAEEYRIANFSSIENSQITTHPQAIYTSRLLNPYTEGLEFDFTK
jgi:serine/threonine protein kinase